MKNIFLFMYCVGGIHKGDQIMMVDGVSLVNIPLARAQQVLREAMKTPGVRIQH